MNPTLIGHHRRTALVWSAVGRTARLAIFGFIGWFWFIRGYDPAGKAVPLVAALVLAALVGITWYASRVRADRRLRRALDRYGEKESGGPTARWPTTGKTQSRNRFSKGTT